MVGLAENIATQPSLARAWAELGNKHGLFQTLFVLVIVGVILDRMEGNVNLYVSLINVNTAIKMHCKMFNRSG